MKKIIFITVIILSASIFTSKADLNFGIKAGLDLTTISFNESDADPVNFTGFLVGPVVDIGTPIFHLETALLFGQKNKNGNSSNDLYQDQTDKETTLTIPVNVRYNVSLLNTIGGYLSAGPDVSFMLQDERSKSLATAATRLQEDIKDKTFRAGINFGAGIHFLKRFEAGIQYHIGITDEYRTLSADSKFLKGKNKTWSITATYFL
ncbi:MAG: PorT family protein [Dysgonamonadaceae bacterium]|jgi:hypothetical protein|nr:PorT family protein [Dysgonamonadaceae bacterium]